MSTRAELALVVLYLNKAEARDKICRAIQYSSKFLSNGQPGTAQNVDKSTGLARKVFRLFKSKNVLLSAFLFLYQIVWPGRSGIYKNKERAELLVYSLRGKAFIDTLLSRLNPRSKSDGGPCMPFKIEVVEAALLSRVQCLEQKLMDIEPRVQGLLEVLPNRLTADVLEQLRISKQALVELSSRAGVLRQMLLDLLEDPHEIHRMCIMGRNCTLRKGSDSVECSMSLEKQIGEEEEEIEMLLENYLQRCESCHGQSKRLLDSAKEMEDSIAVNSRDKKEYTMRLGRKLLIVIVVLK
ncbi:hypothetical protein Q3G72_014337 [Acer saccharum]|nr:hypothetical protein Q3G72_014337 [Acer saccharum]